MNLSQFRNLCVAHPKLNAKWNHEPEQRLLLIQKLTSQAQDTCLSWILTLDPDWMTEVNINFLNSCAYEKHFNAILKEFKNSREYKRLVNLSQTAELTLAKYQEIFTSCYDAFTKRSKHLRTYHREKLEELLPNRLIQNMTEVITATLLAPTAFKRMAKLFLQENFETFFPENTCVDVKGDDSLLLQKMQEHFLIFLNTHPELGSMISNHAYASASDSIFQYVIDYAKPLKKQEINLTKFTGKVLTYAMLKQCVEIWQDNHWFRNPKLIKVIKKILKNKDEELPLNAELTEEAVTALDVSIRRWYAESQKNKIVMNNRILRRITSILSSTKSLKKTILGLLSSTQLHINPPPNDEERNNLTLDKIQEEINENPTYEKLKVRVTNLITSLKYIEEQNKKTDADNYFLKKFTDQVIKTIIIPNGEVHLGFCADWEQAKVYLNGLVSSFMSSYHKAKVHGAAKTFLEKLGNQPCLEAKMKGAVKWATFLGTAPEFNDIMEKANKEAEHYLESTGKSLSLENKLTFIWKHYQRTECKTGLNEKQIATVAPISKTMVKEYLINYLSEEESKLKCWRKSDIIYFYNHYSFKRFRKALEEKSLKTPGLNKLTRSGDTLLIEACRSSKFEHVEALIKKGVDINLSNKRGENAWAVVFQSNAAHFLVTKTLTTLFNTIPPEQREAQAKKLMILAYKHNDAHVFNKILSYITDIEFLKQPHPELNGVTLLAHACHYKRSEHIQKLLAKNIVDSKSAFMNVTLMTNDKTNDEEKFSSISLAEAAIRHGEPLLLRALLDGIDSVEVRGNLVVKLLSYYSYSTPNYGAFEELLKYIHDPDTLNRRHAKETLLTEACLTGNLNAVKMLLKKEGIDYFAPNKEGLTPLLFACRNGYTDIVNTIIKKYKKRLGEQQKDKAPEAAKSILQEALNFNKQSVFFDLCREARDSHFLHEFYDNNFGFMLNLPGFLVDTNIKKLEEAEFFNFLTNPVRVNELIQLLKNSISQKQTEMTALVLEKLTSLAPHEFNEVLPQLLLSAYKTKSPTFELLFKAVTDCDIPSLNLPGSDGETLLTMACADKRLDIIKILGRNLNLNLAAKGNSKTPFQSAVSKGHLDVTKCMLDLFAERSLESSRHAIKDDDLLYTAYINNDDILFKELLVRVSDFNISGLEKEDTRLTEGTFLNDALNNLPMKLDFVQSLIMKGITFSIDKAISHPFSSIYYPLFQYMSKNKKNYECVFPYLFPVLMEADLNLKHILVRQAYLSFKADTPLYNLLYDLSVEIYDLRQSQKPNDINYGFSALHEEACNKKSAQILDELLSNPKTVMAGLEKDSENGRTALHYAAIPKLNSEIAVELYVKKMMAHEEFHACLNVKDFDERLPLHYACMSGSNELVQVFIIDIETLPVSQDRVYQRTPLHYAALSRLNNKMLSLLCDATQIKQNINAIDILGSTALHYVSSWADSAAVADFISKGADSTIQNIYGDTPLHIACRENNLDVVKALMKSKDIYKAFFMVNKNNRTPLDELTQNRGHGDIIKRYLVPLYKLAIHAKKLAQNKDEISKEKANAITKLLISFAEADLNGQKEMLQSINVNDGKNELFKPRNPYYGLFIAPPCKTSTAKEIESLRQVVLVQ